MTMVEKWVPAEPQDVWAILADPRAYAFWVVGSHDILAADHTWPAVGATFRHVQGQGPFKLTDTTTVLANEELAGLSLEVRVRPALIARVDISLSEAGDGTCIRIDEYVTGGALRLLPRAATSPLINLRNADALRRLAGMAWVQAQGRRAFADGNRPSAPMPARTHTPAG